MKPLKLALTPTRNRRLNEVIGMVLLVTASLLFLALASYHPTDPSFNTVGSSAAGAQLDRAHRGRGQRHIVAIGRGRRLYGSPDAGRAGVDLVAIAPCGFPGCESVRRPPLPGLCARHLRPYARPSSLDERPSPRRLTGRLVVDFLIHYLNFPGAAIVVVSMVVIALYLSTTFSFNTAQQWLAVRFAFALAWRDRVRNLYSAWARIEQRPCGEECRKARRPRDAAAGKRRKRKRRRGFPRHGAPLLPT